MVLGSARPLPASRSGSRGRPGARWEAVEGNVLQALDSLDSYTRPAFLAVRRPLYRQMNSEFPKGSLLSLRRVHLVETDQKKISNDQEKISNAHESSKRTEQSVTGSGENKIRPAPRRRHLDWKARQDMEALAHPKEPINPQIHNSFEPPGATDSKDERS